MKIKLKKPTIKLNKNSLRNSSTNLLIKISNSPIIILVSIIIFLIGLNVFSRYFFFRIDLSENQIYSLSQNTKDIISNLDKQITIEVFFSDKKHPEHKLDLQKSIELLKEYERFSQNKIKLKIKDPTSNDFENDALAAGIRQVQFSTVGQDNAEIVTGFYGINIIKEDQNKPIELIESYDNFEYNVTSKIYNLNSNEKQTIAFLSGHGEKNLNSELTIINKFLKDQYNTESITIKDKKIDIEKYPILVIVGPNNKFSDQDKKAIEEYSNAGGKLVILGDLFTFSQSQTGEAVLEKQDININDLISSYGIKFKENVILDESYKAVPTTFPPLRYPFWVNTTSENINNEIGNLSNIESVVFFWSNSLEIDKEKFKNQNFEFIKLIQSSEKAWEQNLPKINLNNQDSSQENPDIENNENKNSQITQIPVNLTDEYYSENYSQYTLAGIIKKEPNIEIVLIGDSDFIVDQWVQGAQQNIIFFMDIIDWLSNSNALSDVRGKNIPVRPIIPLNEHEKNNIKIASSSFIPIFLIVFGISYNLYRNKRKSLI